jgi:predicted nucleic acid-binding protein
VTTKVVDASAAGALLFGEPDAVLVAARLGNATLAAPGLLPFEVASICLKKMRRHPGLRDQLIAAFALLPGLGIAMAEVDHDKALDLAEETNLTAHDASYLWLARSLGAELVTLDDRLKSVAATLI